MRFVFIGGTFRGFILLQNLIRAGYVPDLAFILQEDEHEQRKYANDILATAEEAGIPAFIRKKLNKEDVDRIAATQRDFGVVCGWRTIIPAEVGDSFQLGLVAAHDSLLPAYRGFAPINWAMINNEKETGVTLFLINDGEVDSGDILEQIKVTIDPDDYAIDVYDKIVTATVEGYLSFFRKYADQKLTFTPQDERLATYTCKRTPADGKINWDQPFGDVLNFIRALAPPYPGAFCFYEERKYLIHRAEAGSNSNKKYVSYIPGRVLRVMPAKGIEVMCNPGSVMLTSWENEDGQVMTPSEVIRSISITL